MGRWIESRRGIGWKLFKVIFVSHDVARQQQADRVGSDLERRRATRKSFASCKYPFSKKKTMKNSAGD
jgi:hypothetical protein